MAVKPRRIALPPRVKPSLPVEVDWGHPLLRGCVGFVPFIKADWNTRGRLNSVIVSPNDAAQYDYSVAGVYETGYDANAGYWEPDGFVTLYTQLFKGFHPTVAAAVPTAGELCVTISLIALEPAPYSGFGEFAYFSTNGESSGFYARHVNSTTLRVCRGSRCIEFSQPTVSSGEKRCITVWSKPVPNVRNDIRVYVNGGLAFSGSTTSYHSNSVSTNFYRRFLLGRAANTHTNRHSKTKWLAFYLHTRDIGLDRHRLINEDPYAPIRKRRVLVPVATAGPANHTASLVSGAQPATASITATTGYQTTLSAGAQPAAANLAADVLSVGNHTSALSAGAQPASTNLTATIGYQAPLSAGVQPASTNLTATTGYQTTLSAGAQPADTSLTADITSSSQTATLSAGAQPAVVDLTATTGYQTTLSAGAQPATVSATAALDYSASLYIGAQPAATSFTIHVPEALTAVLSVGAFSATVSLSMTAPIRYNREIGATEFAAPSVSGIANYDPPSKDLGDVEFY